MIDTFLHNWAEEVVVESSWQTTVSVADEDLAEERVGHSDRPVRSISCLWTGLSRDEVLRMILALAKATTDGLQLPIYSDQAITTALSSVTTIHCPTADRRFAVGHDVAIAAFGADGRLTDVLIRTVTVVDAASLTISATLGTGVEYPAGSIVFPLITTQPVLTPTMELQTDGVGDVGLTVLEVQEEALPALDTPGDDPADFDLYGQYPIFDIDPEWTDRVTLGLVREADVFAQGRAQAVEFQGDQPRFRFEMTLQFEDRADAFRLLRFFDSRGGMLAPFYLAAPVTLFTPVDLDTGFVDVETEADATEGDDFFTHVAVIMKDGTHYVRPISGIAQNVGEWRISVSDSFPALDLDDVDRVTPAWLVRFETDALREEWLTDGITRIEMRCVSVIAEDDAAVA